MDPSEANSWEHQQQAIDAEIKSLEESIRALRYRRNALAPISSLPTEVITLIFSFLRARATSAFTPDTKPDPDPLAWLRVTHVCHQWREIALNLPHFWSHIDFTNLSPVGAAEILARAKMVPLYFEASVLNGQWDNIRFSAFQEQLRANLPRICHLLFNAYIYQFDETLKGLRSPAAPAPTLERLSLTCQIPSPSILDAIPGTLFGGITPRLSCLELRQCSLNWKSPLLRGLRYLDIRSPSRFALPRLSVWLDALDEMPQLKMLTLEGASPEADDAGPIPFDVKHTASLPSLTHFDISDSPRDCAFALAHLDLPALTCLSVKTFSSLKDGYDVRDIFPYIAQHAHGSQDAQPLQSVLIRGEKTQANFLAWPVPNIDAEVQGSTLLAKMGPARVALSFWCEDWIRFDAHNEIFGLAMAAVPLDDLVTLIIQDFLTPPLDQPWLNLPRLPLLRHVRMGWVVVDRFIDWLQADKGGPEDPLLPSLKELVIVDARLYEGWTLYLCEALMKRVEQGVSLEMLDLRTCSPDPGSPAAVQLLSDIVVDVLAPEETLEARAHIISIWDRSAHRSFVEHGYSGEEILPHLDRGSMIMKNLPRHRGQITLL